MLDPEERLENLQMELLEAPTSEMDSELIPSLTDEGEPLDTIEIEEESSQGRMIDLPFELFGNDRED